MIMDYTKFFAKITSRRRANLIRKLTKLHVTQRNIISMAGGMPNAATFPIKGMSVTYEHEAPLAFSKHELSTALQYGSSQGYPPLIEKWREFQQVWHAPKRNDWDVAFTTGSMDGCSKIFEMMIDENEPVMIQAPTYSGTIGALAPLSPDVVEISQDIDGIIPEQIAKECEQRLADGRPMPKLLYVNPTGANPTGCVLTESRRRRVYELAQKYDFLIVEDDAYYFIHFLGKQPTSFFSLDTDGRVIRLDSFSKIMSAGIRIGVVTAHKDVVSKLTLHMENSLLHPPSVSQMLIYKLFEIWETRRFEEHFKCIQKFYRERRDAMLAAAEKHLTGLAEWNVPEGGMFFWVKITTLDDVLDLAMNKCVAQNVFLVPGHAFNYDSSKSDSHLRLSYSYASPDDINKGLSILAKLIREEMARKNKVQ